jgi:hypothetical protein
MDIFGIGPLEFLLVLLLALIIFGPNDMAKAGRALGRFLRRLVMSEEWRIITQSAREFRHMPERLMREAGVEDIKKELPDIRRDADLDGLNRDLMDWQKDVSGWTKQADTESGVDSLSEPQQTIAPPIREAKPKTTQPAKPQPSVKNSFSWDEPDIVPMEDESS